jgi:hypothetical protein
VNLANLNAYAGYTLKLAGYALGLVGFTFKFAGFTLSIDFLFFYGIL